MGRTVVAMSVKFSTRTGAIFLTQVSFVAFSKGAQLVNVCLFSTGDGGGPAVISRRLASPCFVEYLLMR